MARTAGKRRHRLCWDALVSWEYLLLIAAVASLPHCLASEVWSQVHQPADDDEEWVSSNLGRFLHTAVQYRKAGDQSNGTVLVFGGVSGGSDTDEDAQSQPRFLNSLLSAEFKAQGGAVWTEVEAADGQAAVPCARAGHAAAVVEGSSPSPFMWVFGGVNGTDAVHSVMDDLWSYDIVAGRWTLLGCHCQRPSRGSGGTHATHTDHWPAFRFGHSLVSVGKVLYLFGGSSDSTTGRNLEFNDLWSFDTNRELKWTLLSDGKSGDRPMPRTGHTLNAVPTALLKGSGLVAGTGGNSNNAGTGVHFILYGGHRRVRDTVGQVTSLTALADIWALRVQSSDTGAIQVDWTRLLMPDNEERQTIDYQTPGKRAQSGKGSQGSRNERSDEQDAGMSLDDGRTGHTAAIVVYCDTQEGEAAAHEQTVQAVVDQCDDIDDEPNDDGEASRKENTKLNVFLMVFGGGSYDNQPSTLVWNDVRYFHLREKHWMQVKAMHRGSGATNGDSDGDGKANGNSAAGSSGNTEGADVSKASRLIPSTRRNMAVAVLPAGKPTGDLFLSLGGRHQTLGGGGSGGGDMLVQDGVRQWALNLKAASAVVEHPELQLDSSTSVVLWWVLAFCIFICVLFFCCGGPQKCCDRRARRARHGQDEWLDDDALGTHVQRQGAGLNPGQGQSSAGRCQGLTNDQLNQLRLLSFADLLVCSGGLNGNKGVSHHMADQLAPLHSSASPSARAVVPVNGEDQPSASTNLNNDSRSVERGDLCSICLCDFEDEDEVVALPRCSHVFHSACAFQWLRANKTCPLCKQKAYVRPANTSSARPAAQTVASPTAASDLQGGRQSAAATEADETRHDIDSRDATEVTLMDTEQTISDE